MEVLEVEKKEEVQEEEPVKSTEGAQKTCS